MKKGVKKHSKVGNPVIDKAIKKELSMMHDATLEYIQVCMELSKIHPQGLDRIKAHVESLTENMLKLDKLCEGD
jgi:hypothetical protein